MAQVMSEFLPAGVINVVTGERATGALLVEHQTPAMVSITGSVAAGMAVAGAASKSLKRVHLELGGKAPVVVFNDADLAAAAEGIAIAGFFNAGQDCTAATRVIVQEGVYEEMVKLLADQASNQSITPTNLSESQDLSLACHHMLGSLQAASQLVFLATSSHQQ
jgi:betaine-aldehyde dehydrogenase